MSLRDPLAGELALVTGGARRIGRAVALRLAREGADLLVHHRTSTDAAKRTAADARDEGVDAWPVHADLAAADAAPDLLDAAEDAAGRAPTRLVNNASVFPQAELDEATAEGLEDAVRVNAWAPVALTREVARRADQAAVVNLLDARAGHADRAQLPYALSKDALASATRLTAHRLAPDVRVNAVAPGPILEPTSGPAERHGRRAEATPLGRAGQPAEVADAVAHLLGAPYTTGAVLPVDGGQHLTGGTPDG
jgi:NAD(P)-dependent dehydrogenase (short-subunit alcohol dehydrogenase family)